jgi:hypothetical protein
MEKTVDENELAKKTKERSPNFPFINLENALERAKLFYQEERKGSAPFLAAARHWGYSPSSSGAMQTVAALKSYGLLTDEGSGAQRKVRLSDLAIRILLDLRPDTPDLGRLKRTAALSPPTAAEIYEKWPDGLPSDPTLHHFLTLERNFSQESAYRVCRIIKENEVFTGNCLSDSLSSTDKEEEDLGMQQTAQSQGDAIGGSSQKPKVGTRIERIIDPEGLDILLQFSGEPTSDSYEFLRDYIDLRLKRIKGKNPN